MIRSFENMWRGIDSFNEDCEKARNWIEPLSAAYVAERQKIIFAAKVKLTDELFLVSTMFSKGRTITAMRDVLWTRNYAGVLLVGSKVSVQSVSADIVVKEAIFPGTEISYISGSHLIFEDKKSKTNPV